MSGLTDRLLYTITAVILILVIGGLVLPNIIGRAPASRIKAAGSQIDRLIMAVETYHHDTKVAPRTLGDLVLNSDGVEGWNGPYVKKVILRDPWRNDYVYSLSADGATVEVVSFGADGQEGGEKANADISRKVTLSSK